MAHAKGWIGLLAGVVMSLALAASVSADDTAGSASQGPNRKLGRGLANIVTCPLELIRTPELVGRQSGYLAGLSVGVVQGVWNGVVRGVTGVYETVTCFWGGPTHYEPLVKPEFVWAHGNWAE